MEKIIHLLLLLSGQCYLCVCYVFVYSSYENLFPTANFHVYRFLMSLSKELRLTKSLTRQKPFQLIFQLPSFHCLYGFLSQHLTSYYTITYSFPFSPTGLCFLSSCVPQHQYFLVKTPKTWYEAQSYCREKCFDLATIDDLQEMETGLKAVEDKYDDAVWIGLRKGGTVRYHWSLADKDFYKEGERNYFIWGKKTTYNCVSHRDGKLYSFGCNYLRYSVCFDGECHSFACWCHTLKCKKVSLYIVYIHTHTHKQHTMNYV